MTMAKAEALAAGQAANLEERIHRMHVRDRLGAIAFVLALWLVMLFVLFSIWPAITNEGIRIVLIAAAVLVLLFNSAAILALLKHYSEDKHFIYGLDLKHLDEMRRRRRA